MPLKVKLKAKTPFGNAGEEVVISEEIFEAYGEDFFENAEEADTEIEKTTHEVPDKKDDPEEETKENDEEDEENPGVIGKIFGNGKNKAILEPKSTK
jgi:hypothetical protein